MKLTYVCDTKLKRDMDGRYYTNGSYNCDVWRRYIEISSNLTVVAFLEETELNKTDAKSLFNTIPDGISIKTVPQRKTIFNYINIVLYFHLKEIILSEITNADAVIIRVPGNNGFIAASICRKLKKPYLIEVIGCSWDSLWNHSIRGKILAPRAYFLQRIAVSKSLYTLYVSNHFLQKRYPTKGKMVACSDVIIEEQHDEQKISMLYNNKFVLGTAASLDVAYKGQQYVMRAVKKMKEKGVPVQYELAGIGKGTRLRKLAESLGIEDSIIFKGSIPHANMGLWYQSLSVYVQMSLQEGMPRAVLEAMSFGKAVVGSNAGGIPELIDGSCVLKKKDVSTLTSKLIYLYNDTSLIKKLGEQNRLKYREYNRYVLDRRRNEFYNIFAYDVKRKTK
ncbi:hypothetical protein AGMMS49992_31750 [Clostridia bacterium]|nr:hypothetical protein AGMMS49992_31750 [Clostridia bacterium]